MAATTVVDLGAEGLTDGDDIDPFLEDHFDDGTEVYIPAGDYQSTFSWWGTSVTNAAVRGDPAGVRLHRPPGLTYEEDDDGSDYKIHERLRFDGHVVIENISLKGKHGWKQNRLDVEGESSDAHLELRNFNEPDGTVGNSDTYVGRAYGSGRVDYKWCYFNEFSNSCFYQLSSGRDIRQVFDGCVFRNVIQAHRGGTRDYTVRNCIYIADGPAPDFCEEDDAPCGGDPWGGSQRPFKMDQSYGWEGRFENLHYFAGSDANIITFLDFQSDQDEISGVMDGLYIYNESDAEMFSFDWDVGSAWDIRNVHMTGPGNLDVPSEVQTVADPVEPTLEYEVWTPNGEGIGTVDPTSTPQPTTPDGGTTDGDDGSSDGGSTESSFEIVSTDEDAHIEYTFQVDGTAEKHETSDDISSIGEDNDVITDNGDGTTTVVGKTGEGFGDAFLVTGAVAAFERTAGDSGVTLLLDGEDVTDEFIPSPDQPTDDPPDDEPTDSRPVGTLQVVSTDPGVELTYAFTVEGSVEKAEVTADVSSVGESNDVVTDNGDGTVTVTGLTGEEFGDAFTVTGRLLDFEKTGGRSGLLVRFDGPAAIDAGDSGLVTIDGRVAPDDLSQYRLGASDEISRDPDNSSVDGDGLPWDAMGDVVDGSEAIGIVGNGVDAYRYSGAVTYLEVDGLATPRIEARR